MKSFSDHINLFSKVSPKKWMNASRILSSYYRSRYSGKPNISGYPFSIGLEPTTSCNLRCPECPSGLRSFTRPTGHLTEATFQRTINELEEYLIYLTFYFQGEPYLNPDFLTFVDYASSRGIYTTTSTNAHYLDETNARKTIESGLDRIIISIDGTEQDTYEQYRVGGILRKVLDGTRNLVNWRKELKSVTPKIVFQFLVVKPNEHQVNDVRKLAKELGVDKVVLKTAQIYDFENGSPLIPRNPKFSRYKQTSKGNWVIKNPLDNHCWKMWHSCVVTWDGTVVPCCFDKDSKYPMGNIASESFKEIWLGEAYQKFRESILLSRKGIDICRNCTEGTRVIADPTST